MATHDRDDQAELGIAGLIFAKLPQEITLVIIIFIVAIPEGLPLVVGMSLAFSVQSMNKDNILVRKLDAQERLGSIDEILCGKTGTITKN